MFCFNDTQVGVEEIIEELVARSKRNRFMALLAGVFVIRSTGGGICTLMRFFFFLDT